MRMCAYMQGLDSGYVIDYAECSASSVIGVYFKWKSNKALLFNLMTIGLSHHSRCFVED